MSRRFVVLALLVACRGRGAGETQSNIAPPAAELELAGRPLTQPERAKVDEHGFSILAGGAAQSFHVGYTALFHAHQPVYITADSLLYAWHSSYDKILTDVERGALMPALGAMLEELRGGLAQAAGDPQARADLDVYLTVADSFAKGKEQPPVAGGDPAAINAAFTHGQAAEGLELELFGAGSRFDFSMLKPRGHYTSSADLQQYFRVMSWLGRAEIAIAKRIGANGPWRVNRRALAASLLLESLVTEKIRARWTVIDSTLAALIGPADSMSLPGLAAAHATLRAPLDQLTDDEIVAAFRAPSEQKIRTQLAHAGDSSIAFLLLGQRYVADSGVLSNLTHGSLETDPPRLMPTPLDVAHAVFGNPAAKTLLAPEIAKYGAPYQRALAQEASTAVPPNSLAHLWLRALRELSPDAARDARLPKPLTSEAWARRMLVTQLASWAELRHDNLLYTKQSFTAELGCAFPDAYIDPYPAFYAGMEAMAASARTTIEGLAMESSRQARIVGYFTRMATTMGRLREIAERERANTPMTAADLDFINHMVSLDARSVVCAMTTDPHGWYAELFYEEKTALWHDPVIADVHTQPTDEAGNMVGRVLHVGTGMPRMMEIKIQHDGGSLSETYRGFVSNYAEVITEDFHRMTDEEWREQVGKKMIGTPPWLESIVAR